MEMSTFEMFISDHATSLAGQILVRFSFYHISTDFVESSV